MKQFLILTATIFTTLVYGQDVKTSNEKISFSHGSFDAIVVNIPHGNKETIEKELRSEMKDWGGKFDSSKDEYVAKGAKMKAMGDKYFDGYAKIFKKGDDFYVAFAVDLGGAYLTHHQHKEQHKIIEGRVIKFAKTASTQSIKDEIEAETKILTGLQKEQKGLESDIEESKKDIEDYKKKIQEEEAKIEKNESALSSKKSEVEKQAAKLAEVKAKL